MVACNVIVVGEKGGKRSLINTLVGLQVSTLGGGQDERASECRRYIAVQDGLVCRLWDTPTRIDEKATLGAQKTEKALQPLFKHLRPEDGNPLLVFCLQPNTTGDQDLPSVYESVISSARGVAILVVAADSGSQIYNNLRIKMRKECAEKGIVFEDYTYVPTGSGLQPDEVWRVIRRRAIPPQVAEHKRQEINIILFGETGVGKSSVVNMIAGRRVADISRDALGCTMSSRKYDIPFGSYKFSIWDTVGLDEPEMGVNGFFPAIKKAYELIEEVTTGGGINLLLFCLRGGRVTMTIQSNYRLFYEVLCQEKVPIGLVITHLEHEDDMEDYWRRNEDIFSRTFGIKSAGHACITGMPRLQEKYNLSRLAVHGLLADCNHFGKYTMPPSDWMVRFTAKFRSFIRVGEQMPRGKRLSKALIKKCGFTPEIADRVRKELEGKILQADRQYTPEDIDDFSPQMVAYNIVFVGETGHGKSSLVNLLVQREASKTCRDVLGGTDKSQRYITIHNSGVYRLWDTPGFNGGTQAIVPAQKAGNMLRSLLKNLMAGDGVHLLILCLRFKKAITSGHYKIYESILSCIRGIDVPVVAAITHADEIMQALLPEWNVVDGGRKVMKVVDYACVSTLDDEMFPVLPGRRKKALDDMWRLIQHWAKPLLPTDSPLQVKILFEVKVVLFGETGVGKSSVVNLITGQPTAEVRRDARGCTLSSNEYQVDCYPYRFRIWDTAGLNSLWPGEGFTPATEQASQLIRENTGPGGINLLLLCIRGDLLDSTTVQTKYATTIQTNYMHIFEMLCEKRVPVGLVITHLEDEVDMEDYWKRNGKIFYEYLGIESAGHACITGLSQIEGKYILSREAMYGLLTDCDRSGVYTVPLEPALKCFKYGWEWLLHIGERLQKGQMARGSG
ncbi:hypothetical protein ID866_7540 [Astraeus odoratus]|nr:hypothetical protein ID866_7540 [Astraeus odoratus]